VSTKGSYAVNGRDEPAALPLVRADAFLNGSDSVFRARSVLGTDGAVSPATSRVWPVS
jgi:hypothetical protein